MREKHPSSLKKSINIPFIEIISVVSGFIVYCGTTEEFFFSHTGPVSLYQYWKRTHECEAFDC